MNDYLPIGSIVKLKKGITKVMIIGYCKCFDSDKIKNKDYIACVYPTGIVDFEKVIAFKKSDIEEILLSGASMDEYKLLNEILNR